ncbi:cupin domain-containing protein [Inquilinus sp.]|jgi:mannose-6-phosphate isomerase-like protein (cupin superfamily)|uniref:cupin domain-containing protein n=1 Tax=Inquilinus sp. TaxID=1932117 RepID=UPI0037830D14
MTSSPSAPARTTGRGDQEEWIGTRPGEHCLIRIAAEDTGGVYSVVEIVSDPGDGTPLHVHQNEDEHFLILEGTARINYGDRTFNAKAGDTATLLRGIPHAWRNAADIPLRMAVTCTPGGVEDVFRIIARGGEIDLPALAAKSKVQVLGPMPTD